MPYTLIRHAFSASLIISMGGFVMARTASADSDSKKMSFSITSAGPGNGADLSGLDGADAHRTTLAKSEGSKKSSCCPIGFDISLATES